jgi:hypothetical protein
MHVSGQLRVPATSTSFLKESPAPLEVSGRFGKENPSVLNGNTVPLRSPPLFLAASTAEEDRIVPLFNV